MKFKKTHIETNIPYEHISFLLGCIILTIGYAISMFYSVSRPGANPVDPEGWWGWFDQGQYIKSVRALARFDFTASQHWYPLGYPILGALFERWMPVHPFLFVDLSCLLASFGGFVGFARRCGFSIHAAVVAFLLGSIGSTSIWVNWIIPWTTTPSCAVIWIFLALCVSQLVARDNEPVQRRWWRIGALGLVAVAIPMFRPTDVLIPGIGLTLMLYWGLRDKKLRLGDPLCLFLGAIILLLPYGLLYLRIYGLHATEYMVYSRKLGFRFSELPFKTIMLLVSPRPWFPYGAGLLERLPWIAAGFAGMLTLPWLRAHHARRGMTMLALMMLAYMALFFSYVDLLPSGLWLYDNVHYFKWTMLGLALFGWMFVRALFSRRWFPASFALGVFMLLSAIRLTPVAVPPGAKARMLQYVSPAPRWDLSYLGHAVLSDGDGVFNNIDTMRILPDSQGLRAISLSRPFVGPLVWKDRSGMTIPADAPSKEWGIRVSLGWPCWLPSYPCDRLKPGS